MPTTTLPTNLMQTHYKLARSLPFYAKEILKIKPKGGGLVPLVLNRAQVYTHRLLEEQLKRTGMVRSYIVKGRQLGESTYVSARYRHKCIYNEGSTVFILTHRDDATQNLYAMSQRYHRHTPKPLQPKLIRDKADKTIFANGSEYSLGTAASGDVGRSMTVQLFHGSEVAFWKNADEIQTGLMQTIGEVPGTEIIFESTAKGPKGMFYQGVKDVLNGKDKEFQIIFIPWFWEYTKQLSFDEPFQVTDEEQMLLDSYPITLGNLNWRRGKIVQLKADWKFKQEYPNNPLEAFQTTDDTLISSEAIALARNTEVSDPTAPILMGVDSAGTGDRTVISLRQGSVFLRYILYDRMEDDRLAGIMANLFDKYKCSKMFIDMGYGHGTYHCLRTLGYGQHLVGVHFNETPLDKDRFMNKRAEMLYSVKEWIEGSEGPVSIPDEDELAADLLCVPEEETTSNGKIRIVEKKAIKKEYGMSPDIFDSIALTFAYPVARDLTFGGNTIKNLSHSDGERSSCLTTLNRHRRVGKSTIRTSPHFRR